MKLSFDLIGYLKDKGQPIIDAVLVFIIGWYGAKLLLFIIMRMIKRSSADPIVISFIKSVLDIVFKVLVIVTTIAQLGVNTSSLVTLLATGGAAIVLGLKDSMTGVVSGMIILFTKPFVKGDIIEVNHYIGKIQKIELLYTFLLTFDNKLVVIPNNELASSSFVNYSHEDIRRVDLTMQVHYDSDIEKVKSLMMDVVKKHEYSLEEPAPYIRVSEFQEHAIAINLRVWTQTEHYYELKDDLIELIKEEFDKNGVVIPYNQLDIHVINKENT